MKPKYVRPFSLISLVVTVAGLGMTPVLAQTSWNIDAAGSWSTPGNWSAGVPSTGVTANFGSVISQARTVTMDTTGSAAGLGFLTNFVNDGVYTIAGTNALTLDSNGIIQTGSTSVANRNGGANINAPLTLSTGTAVMNVHSLGSNGTLALGGTISGSSNLVKNGLGSLNLGAIAHTFTGDITINNGFLQVGADGALGNVNNDVYLNGGVLTVGNFAWNPAATRVINVNAAGGGLNITGNTTTLASAGQLAGAGTLQRYHNGTLIVTAANTGLTGKLVLRGGLTDMNASNGLGSGAVTVAKLATLRTNQSTFGSQVFQVANGGAIDASNVALGTLTRGTNLFADQGAIIVEQAAGGNASIANLGTAGDLYFGVGGGAAIASENMTLGTGSAWRGISTGRAGYSMFGSTGNQISKGTATINSDFDLQAPINWLVLGTTGAGNQFEFSGATARVATIRSGNGSQVGGAVVLGGDTPVFSGVSRFVVEPGAVLWPTGAQGLGNKPVELQKGAILGHTGNAQGTVASNSLGTSVIDLAGINQVNIRGAGGTAAGGSFRLNSSLPNQFNMNRDSSGTNGAISITDLTITANNAGASITNGNNRTLGISGSIAGGIYDFTLAPQGGTHTIAGTWTGSGTFTKGDTSQINISGDASGYTGNVVVRLGTLQLNSTYANNFGGAGGSNTYKIVAGTTNELRYAGYATLLLNSDSDIGSRIAASSDGVLGLLVNNSTLTGVNGSAAYIAPNGGGRTLSTSTLAAGSSSTYRLGGGNQTLTMDSAGAGVLTGANNLVVGGPRNNTSGTGAWFNGIVQLNDTNDYTGTTRVNGSSSLTLNSANALGNGASLGDIEVFGTLNVGGGSGTGSIGAAVPTNLTVQRGGLLSIDDSNAVVANRVPDATTIKLNGIANFPNLTYLGRNSAATTSTETLGTTQLLSGFNTVTVNRQNATNTVTLTLSGITRDAGTQFRVIVPNGTLGGGTTNPNLMVSGLSTGFIGGWAYAGDTDFATYGANGVAALGGTRPTLAAATAGSDPVSTANDTLGSALTVNSYRLSGGSTVNLNGNALTISSGGLMHASGTAAAISNGSITTTGSELIINGTSAATTISANLTGTNGITVRHAGTLSLTGTGNSFSGQSYLNGGTTLVTRALSGNPNIDISPGATLALRNDASTTFLAGSSTITIKGPSLATATINVDRETVSGVSSSELRIKNLTVEDDARLTLSNGNNYHFVATGAVTLGANSVVSFNSNSESNLIVRGTTFSDTATTVYRDAGNQFVYRYSTGLVFDNAVNTNVVNGIFGFGSNNRAALQAIGSGTEVSFQGTWAADSGTSHWGAFDGGKLVIGASAVVDNSMGWSGQTYAQSVETNLSTGNGGVVEFASGFVAKRTVGTADRTDVNWGGHFRISGDFTTNHSQNLSDYQMHMGFESPDATWTVQTNAQSMNAPMFIRNGNTHLKTDAALTVNSPVFLGTGAFSDAANITRDWQQNSLLQFGQNSLTPLIGQITKSGAADLNLDGPVVVSNVSRLLSTQGVLNLRGTVYSTVDSVLDLRTDIGTGTVNLNPSVSIASGSSLEFQSNGTKGAITIGSSKSADIHGTLFASNATFVSGSSATGRGVVDVTGTAQVESGPFAYTFSGTGGLKKTTGGTATLTGIGNYSGTTAVDAGILKVNGDFSAATGAVSVALGATLGGTGALGGAVTVNNGGILSPGASLESLSTGALILTNGSTFQYEMDHSVVGVNNADLQIVNGVLNLTGTVNLTLTDLASTAGTFVAPGTTLSLIQYTSSWNNGFFTYQTNELINHEQFFDSYANRWEITYDATSGGSNFATALPGSRFITLTSLTAIPEPASLFALGCLVASGTFLRRRTRK